MWRAHTHTSKSLFCHRTITGISLGWRVGTDTGCVCSWHPHRAHSVSCPILHPRVSFVVPKLRYKYAGCRRVLVETTENTHHTVYGGQLPWYQVHITLLQFAYQPRVCAIPLYSPVSVPILCPREVPGMWSQNFDRAILRCSAVRKARTQNRLIDRNV